MNCQELALVLDEQELHQLPEGERAVAQEHLASCVQCASDHEIHILMAALPVPPLDADRIAEWRALAAGGSKSTCNRGVARGRLMLFGTLAAVMAAAALLVASIWDGEKQSMPESLPAPVPQFATGAPATPEAVRADAQPTERDQSGSPGQAAGNVVEPLALRPVTMIVQALEYNVTDPAVQRAAQEFYGALVDGLRTLPAVTVIGPRQSIDPPDDSADFVLTGKAQPGVEARMGDGGPAQWAVRLRLRIRRGESALVQPIQTGGMLPGPACEGATCGFSDPVVAAESILKVLGPMMFPGDPVLERELQARLQDGSQPASARQWALTQLIMMKQRSGRVLDEREIQVALDIAASSPDEWLRLSIWRNLRGVQSPELIRQLIGAATGQDSDSLRLEAVTQLAQFREDGSVRPTLEWLAINDADELVRKAAERAVAGPVP